MEYYYRCYKTLEVENARSSQKLRKRISTCKRVDRHFNFMVNFDTTPNGVNLENFLIFKNLCFFSSDMAKTKGIKICEI